MEDGRIQGWVRGQNFFIYQVFIHEQLGISKEKVVDTANATFDEVKTLVKIGQNVTTLFAITCNY